MSNAVLFAATEADKSGGGGVLVGCLVIVGIIWLIGVSSNPKSKGFNINHESRTRVTPRK